MKLNKYGVYARRKTYPPNWCEIKAKIRERDGDICTKCKRSGRELRQLGIKLVTAHVFSVKTGNNRAMNRFCEKCYEAAKNQDL